MLTQRPAIYGQIDGALAQAPRTIGLTAEGSRHPKVAGIVAMRGVQELEKKVSNLESLVDQYRLQIRTHMQQLRTLESRIKKIEDK